MGTLWQDLRGTVKNLFGIGRATLDASGLTAARTFTLPDAAGALMLTANNLSDLTNAGTARTNLGLGTLATQSGTFSGTSSGTNSGDQTITLTGDVTGSGAGSFAATIANDAVTYAKMQNVSATDKLLGRSTAGSGDVEEIACTAAGRALLDDADAATQRVTIGLSTIAIAFVIDGGGATITTGVKGDITIPFACTITEWTLLADQSGSIQIDIWKDTYANYPPTVADTITASAKPLFSTATKGQSSTLTGWTTSIAAGDTLRFNVDSVTTCQRVTLSLKVTR